MAGKRKGIGIATVLTLVFGGLVALSMGTLLFLSLSNALQSTRDALAARLEPLIYDAAERAETFYAPLQENARWLAAEIAAGKLDPDDQEHFKSILVGITATAPQFAAISYQKPDGTGYFFEPGTNILHQVTWPRALQVNLKRKSTSKSSSVGQWVLRPSVLDGKPNGTFIIRVNKNGQDVGVVAARVDLAPLAKSLATNADFRGFELTRFLLFNKTVLIGHPKLQMKEDVRWPAVSDVDDPYLQELDTAEREELEIVGEIPGVESFALETDHGTRIFATTSDDDRETGGEVLIGVHFDPRAGAAEYNRLLSSAVIGGALLLGSVLLALFLGRRAAVPMARFAHAAEMIQNNQLEEVERLPDSPVKEFATASAAFNEMVEGLKERRRIRDLFGKYVPQDVADMLLADDSAAEPRNAEATVFFLDIAGFSTLSERLTPAEVVATINAFFSDAVHLIEIEGGMITQFQGDAILAAFNVPVERPDHAAAAVRAASAIVQTTSDKLYAGHQLKCRIGINTGPLVAGAIGAKDQLSYTIYGDAVNVAARLEQMNKEFGTTILVSEPTTKLAEKFAFRDIGECPIRGRASPVRVYTLVD